MSSENLPFVTPNHELNYFSSLPPLARTRAWIKLHNDIIEDGEIEENRDESETFEEAAENFWETWLEYVDNETLEESLIDSLKEEEEYPEIFDAFHIFYGRNPEEILEKKRIENEYSEKFQTAFRKSMEGDDASLEELYGVSPGTLRARSDRKRIAKKVQKCFVCGTDVPLGNGELLLEHEVPPKYRELGVEGTATKWFTRCYDGPCSDESLGKRIFEVGHRVKRVTPNKLADDCFVCGDRVEELQGFLVHYTLVPPKSRKKMPWKKAKRKKYYVVCNKNEPDVWLN